MSVFTRFSGRWLAVGGFWAFVTFTAASGVEGQGCMPATPQPLPPTLVFEVPNISTMEEAGDGPLFDFEPTGGETNVNPGSSVGRTTLEDPMNTRGARDLQILEPGTWSFSASFRYYKSGDTYVGSKQVGKNFAIGEYPSLNLSGTYSFNDRWNLSVALPFVNPRDEYPHDDGVRRTSGPGLSIGDLRVSGSYWVFDPTEPRRGNVVVALGVKAPTGDYGVRDTYYTLDGPVEVDADLAVQPGDGGWGVILATQGFRTVARRTYVYGDGFYLLNPRDTTGTVNPFFLSPEGEPTPLSVPDYYQARAGFGYMAWPQQGISLSLGLRLDGIPTEDLVGDSNGFRRPGYNLAVDPGITINWGGNVFSLFVPFSVARSQKQSLPEKELGLHFGGSMAAEAFLLYYTKRF